MANQVRRPPAIKRRHKPNAGLEYAEAVLFEEMEHALSLLRSEYDFGRSAAGRAVYACYSFLHVRGLGGRELAPLHNLLRALEDVANGTLPELFDPKAIANADLPKKWSRSWAGRQTRIYAAACMDALMKTRTNGRKAPAARIVTEHAQKWPRVSGGMIKTSTVTNWRDGFLQATSDDSDRLMFKRLSAVCSTGPRAATFLGELLTDGPFAGGMKQGRPPET